MDVDVGVARVDTDLGGAVADGAKDSGPVSRLGRGESEIVFNIAAVGFDFDGQARFFGDRQIDGAIGIIYRDVTDGRCAGDIDRAVAVGQFQVSYDALQVDIAAASIELGWSDHLAA